MENFSPRWINFMGEISGSYIETREREKGIHVRWLYGIDFAANVDRVEGRTSVLREGVGEGPEWSLEDLNPV